MEDARSRSGRLPLHALLSYLLVAFTIEFDNEFEHQMPHRTTRHGSTPGPGPAPWLVSMPMWVHCMRFVPEDGIAAGKFAKQAGLSAKSAQMILKRMSKWWGYLVVEPDPGDNRVKPPPSSWPVRPTASGRQAQHVWEPLTGAIEARWRARFGEETVELFRASLSDVVGRFDIEMPDYLPIGEARLEPLSTPLEERLGTCQTLPALMSKVLLAFALDFERESDLSLGIYTASGVDRLAISANILRVLDEEGVRVVDIPVLTGVAKMTIDNWLRSLEEHRYAIVGPDSAGSRFKMARLTQKGLRARDTYFHWADRIELESHERLDKKALAALRTSTEQLAVASPARLLLWDGIDPYPDGWRAQLRRPETLPHFPVISHRGGFPDGS